ncbi:glutathione S-transferase family protein [Endozoicomonas lisbonensis]|uniref:Glutathione S-transferase n=1 Tax=Endozoicomonas lisbonensis TaxID=3120522 RepID=A0ABV2SHP1_9GAMM
MISLYGSGQARSFRALWALEEAGLDFEYHHVKIGQPDEGGSRHPSYLALNSQGKIPTLVHDDLVLTESAAIVNYIAALAPEKQLMPLVDNAMRAKYDEFCFFVLSDLEQPLWTTGKHRFVLPKDYRVEAVLETAQWEFKRSLKALDQYMDGQEYVVGNHFTCADILLAQTINWALRFEFEVPEPYQEYRERLYQRPACQRAAEAATAK